MTFKHFEELWTEAEFENKKNSASSSLATIKSLLLKLEDTSNPSQTTKRFKSKLIGNILFQLAGISKIEDINVYEALSSAIQYSKLTTLGEDDEVSSDS